MPDRATLPIAEQDRLLRGRWDGVEGIALGQHIGYWRLSLCPIAQRYLVGILLVLPTRLDRADLWPRATLRVLDPELCTRADAPDKPVPHLYRNSDGRDSLCLYDPGVESAQSEWQTWMPLATTIVPWTAEWLGYYEFWLATGRWHGPEVMH
jgi:hypothetical protein